MMSARNRIKQFFEDNVGKIVTTHELSEVAGIRDYQRRIRELRNEYGMKIRSHVDRADLKPGEYVIVVFHDLSNNGKIEKNRVGIPVEPIGLSNHPKIGIGGPPDFNKAKVDVSKDVTVKIVLNKVGR